MSDVAVMPYEDYAAACDAIREQTGTTELIKSGNMAKMISEIEGCGSNVAPIIDVCELPTENISESNFYRLVTAKFVNAYTTIYGWICHCVDGLPEVGEPVSTDMVNITAYYNTQDGEVYGYADSNISATGGIPVGWYPIGTLAQAFNISWGGVITDAKDGNGTSNYVLLKYDFYVYKNEWLPFIHFAYEKMPEFDIQWDGVIGDRLALDISALGVEGFQLVKVSDQSLTVNQLVGSSYVGSVYIEEHIIEEGDISDTTYAGAIVINDFEIVSIYSADDANAALGLPSGYLTNGLYFAGNPAERKWIRRLVAPSKIVKLDSKYLDVDFSEYSKTTEVEVMIANAIGNAIGGSY